MKSGTHKKGLDSNDIQSRCGYEAFSLIKQLPITTGHNSEKLYRPAVDLVLQTAFQHRASHLVDDKVTTKLSGLKGQGKCVLAKVCRARAYFTYFEKRVETTIIAVQHTHHVTCGTALCHISTEIAAGFVYVVIDKFA